MHLVFDLDDTLYEEIDYVFSALSFSAKLISSTFNVNCSAESLFSDWQKGDADVLKSLWEREQLPEMALDQVLAAMRAHDPAIQLSSENVAALNALQPKGNSFSILTDGRSITQRQKISALKLTGWFEAIYISEETGHQKPELNAYLQISKCHEPETRFMYIGDNPNKDFVTANHLGWKTIMLRSKGRNIHNQSRDLPASYCAQAEVDSLEEICGHL